MAKKKTFSQYRSSGEIHIPDSNSELSNTLDSGVYTAHETMDGTLFFKEFNLETDELVLLPNSESERVLSEMKFFWQDSTRKLYNNYGMLYKRGLLMYGVPGTGKTATIMQMIEQMVLQDTIILYENSPTLIARSLDAIHSIEPNKKIVVVLEECDAYVNSKAFLGLLDGENSHGNVFYIATTNFINNIPNRVKNRPSRFATLVEVLPPNSEARRAYIQSKVKNEAIVEDMVELTNGFVIDSIKDVIISTLIFNVPLIDAINKVKTYSTVKESKSEDDIGEEYKKVMANLTYVPSLLKMDSNGN